MASQGGYGVSSNRAELVISDLLRRFFREDADDPSQVHAKVAAAIRTHHRELEADLLALLDMPVTMPPGVAWMRVGANRRSLDAEERPILVESHRQPLLPGSRIRSGSTQAVLDTLVESLPAAWVLLVVTYCPEPDQAARRFILPRSLHMLRAPGGVWWHSWWHSSVTVGPTLSHSVS